MEEQSKGSTIVSALAGISVVGCIAGTYLGYDIFVNKTLLSKQHFVCTQIEQVGKNMDEVVCTQYTHQKYSKAAVTANTLLVQR
jgi:hypothetical protein